MILIDLSADSRFQSVSMTPAFNKTNIFLIKQTFIFLAINTNSLK